MKAVWSVYSVTFYFLRKFQEPDSHRIHLSDSDYAVFFMAQQSQMGHGLLIIEASLSHSVRHATLGRTPLDEWSAPRRDLYLKTHNTHKRQTYMPPVGFEPAIPTRERPQTRAMARPLESANANRFITKCRFIGNYFGLYKYYKIESILYILLFLSKYVSIQWIPACLYNAY